MVWEPTVICILGALLVAHAWFGKIHTSRIERFGADMHEMERSDATDEMYEESLDCARMYAQAKADRRNNLHAITVYVVCLTGLVIMYLLNLAGLVDAMGWASFLVVPLPVYLSVDHLRTAVLPFKLKRRSLIGEH